MNSRHIIDRLIEDGAQDKEARLWAKAVTAAKLEPESLAGKVVRVDLDNCHYYRGKVESDYSAVATITSAGGLASLNVEIDFSDRSCGIGPVVQHMMDAAGIDVDDDNCFINFEEAVRDAIIADDHRSIIVHCLTGKVESQIEGEAV